MALLSGSKTQQDPRITEQRKAEAQAFIRDREKARGAGLNKHLANEFAVQKEEGRSTKQVTVAEAQASPFLQIENLTEQGKQRLKTQEPVDLKPEGTLLSSATAQLATPGLAQITALGNFATRNAERLGIHKLFGKEEGFARTTPQQLLDENPVLSRVLGGAITGIEATLLTMGTAGLGRLLAIRAGVQTAATGASIAGYFGAATGIGGIAGFKSALDLNNRQKINTFTGLINGVPGDVTIEVKGVLVDPDNAAYHIEQLQKLEEDVNFAEERINFLSNDNLKFRTSQEYLTTMDAISDARKVINNGYSTINNIVQSGKRGGEIDVLELAALLGGDFE